MHTPHSHQVLFTDLGVLISINLKMEESTSTPELTNIVFLGVQIYPSLIVWLQRKQDGRNTNLCLAADIFENSSNRIETKEMLRLMKVLDQKAMSMNNYNRKGFD